MKEEDGAKTTSKVPDAISTNKMLFLVALKILLLSFNDLWTKRWPVVCMLGATSTKSSTGGPPSGDTFNFSTLLFPHYVKFGSIPPNVSSLHKRWIDEMRWIDWWDVFFGTSDLLNSPPSWQEKTRAISDMSAPKGIYQLRVALDSFSYYRKFWSSFSTISSPFNCNHLALHATQNTPPWYDIKFPELLFLATFYFSRNLVGSRFFLSKPLWSPRVILLDANFRDSKFWTHVIGEFQTYVSSPLPEESLFLSSSTNLSFSFSPHHSDGVQETQSVREKCCKNHGQWDSCLGRFQTSEMTPCKWLVTGVMS